MKKPIIILLHGMGKYPSGEIVTEFSTAADKLLNQFPKFKTAKISDKAEIKEINFDAFFDTYRKKMADRSKPIAERLGAANLAGFPGLVSKLTAIESKYGDDDFVYTHLLDVFFYTSFLGEKVRLDVAKSFVALLQEFNDRRIYIVAHSLGTAVIHDTLAKLYRGDFDAYEDAPSLGSLTNRIQSMWMIANVSKVVNKLSGITDPLTSRVRPSGDGCTNKFNNVHHKLDPFTFIDPFEPKDDGSWIPADNYLYDFLDIETSAIRSWNTHDLSEYIENPRVGVPLLQDLFRDFRPDEEDINDVTNAFQATTIDGAFDVLKEELRDMDIKSVASIKDLSDAIVSFRKVIKNLGFEE